MFYYFGYGSNLNLTSLRAKGVEPCASELAMLHGWRLVFNVRHWFRHEGGVGNIQPSAEATDHVQGLLHQCQDEHLTMLDLMESYGVGYDRIEIEVVTARGPVRAYTYVGLPDYLDNNCLPSRRYLNIMLQGATRAGLDEAYVEGLRRHPVQAQQKYPPFQHPGGELPSFNSATLAQYPQYTALAGAVFDMEKARPDLDCLKPLFGGRDMTLFHLKRLDSSDGNETLADIIEDRISDAGREYLNAYLHEYAREYRYVGRYKYD